MKNIYVLLLIIFTGVGTQAQEFEKLWEINTLEAPESVVFNKERSEFYVSNVAGQPAEKNGMGYISTLNKNGEVLNKKWITGLNAPKGMALFNNRLFIADIDRVLVADVTSGNIVIEYQADGATFLNDVEVDKNGTVYVTDTFGGNAIYRIKEDEISLWLKDENLNYPNGLIIKDDVLYVSTWGVVTNPETFETEVPGVLLGIDLNSRKISRITTPFGNLDGLQTLDSSFLVSDWIAGGLLAVNEDGTVRELKDLNAGSADILFLSEENLLLVPQMLDGALTAYSVSN